MVGTMWTKATNVMTGRHAVTVAEMARLCSLSRTHFWSLIRKGVMPSPVYTLSSRRPFYPRELQQAALAVRETNVGYDGSYALFLARRKPKAVPAAATATVARGQKKDADQYADLLDGLRALGMPAVSNDQVSKAVAELYPHGVERLDQGVVLRAVWTHLRRPSGV